MFWIFKASVSFILIFHLLFWILLIFLTVKDNSIAIDCKTPAGKQRPQTVTVVVHEERGGPNSYQVDSENSLQQKQKRHYSFYPALCVSNLISCCLQFAGRDSRISAFLTASYSCWDQRCVTHKKLTGLRSSWLKKALCNFKTNPLYHDDCVVFRHP